MGYVGDGGRALKRNHAMIRGSGHTFKKQAKFVSNGGQSVKVNEARMADLAKKAQRRELFILSMIVVVAILLVMLWIIKG